MTFFTKYNPAPCDKKCRSEHQTLFPLFRGGSGNETSDRQLAWGLGTRPEWWLYKDISVYLIMRPLLYDFMSFQNFSDPLEDSALVKMFVQEV